MSFITSVEIKEKFFNFFQSKDHTQIKSSSIIPKNDPTLLFINSGMAPIKKFFTGEEKPESPRLFNIQPCVRTIDIDDIGDKHHLTSFQMLGSWSINNYFKEKAIFLAFEFLTKHLNIPKEKLYVTVFAGDESLGLDEDLESKRCWENAGIEKDHIISLGKDDNFWGPTSKTGPCGPCTEVFYDTGKGKKYISGGEFDTEERYIEIWNAGVFMQLNKNEDGSYTQLKFKSVDTGAGIERLAMVLNSYDSVYQTDLLAPIKEKIESLLDNKIKFQEKDLRILVDHLRTAVLILSEDVYVSNEGRGYIPRKLIRKCMLVFRKYKIEDFDFESLLKLITLKYSQIYSQILEKESLIISEFSREITQFKKILVNSLEILDKIKNKKNEISGEEIFDLVTAHGLPFDVIKDYASDLNMEIDEAEFKKRLSEHKQVSKNSKSKNDQIKIIDTEKFCSFKETNFVGYDNNKTDASILGFFVNGDENYQNLKFGDEIEVILDSTCMYAESGGQMSDCGFILNDDLKIKINSVKKTKNDVFVHFGSLISGEKLKSKKVLVEIDTKRREVLSIGHTAVHLLHSAIREIFGNGVNQCGSKIDEKNIRFDFNLDRNLNEDEIFQLEDLVNSYIRQNVEKKTEIKDISDAINQGAIALFQNKYKSQVRVVSFGEISSELCAGTHCVRTGNIGVFCIISVESIGKGLKRITATVGENAFEHLRKQRETVKEISIKLKVKPDKIYGKIDEILEKNKKKDKYLSTIDEKDIKIAQTKGKIKFGYIVKDEFDKSFNETSINISEKISGVFLCIAGKEKKRLILSVASSVKSFIKANEIINKITEPLGGKGGGNDKVASAGVVADEKEIIKVFSKL